VADPQRARFSFVFGAVFDADDRVARYVTKLSVAMEDLRMASRYAGRRRQRRAERLYFVRLMAAHLRELVLLLDPPDPAVIPSVEEFLASLPTGVQPSKAQIRAAHRNAVQQLATQMAVERPLVLNRKAKMRRPTLRDDLRALRNRFFHYGHDAAGDQAMRDAMRSLATRRTSYVVKTRTKRSEYAYLIGETLAHPFPFRFARGMHEAIFDLLGPVSSYVQLAEDAWLYAHAESVVLRRRGEPAVRMSSLTK